MLTNISQKVSKIGQLIKYNMRNILFPDPFLKNQS